MSLHPNLAKVFRRVEADATTIGQRFPAVVRDLSTNGAFVAGEPLPLLSRVTLKFDLDGFGGVEAVGWILWRRSDDCEVPGPDGKSAFLPRGIGILFEAVPLDARTAIARLVNRP
jgi:hypothetical protein